MNTTMPTDVGFRTLGVPAPVADALSALGITDPFPIQSATLPDALAGRDVLGRGRTGSGKTVAFAVPLVAALAEGGRTQPKRPRGLVLVPTRELARQVVDTLAPLAAAMGLSVTTVHGGVSQVPQLKALRRGVDIVVACPGRLEDLIGQGHCRLDDVAVTVLDEADHMADLGFLPSVRRLLDRTPSRSQRLLFSATLDNGVDVLVRNYLDDPVRHSVDDAAAQVPDMEHHLLCVVREDRGTVVRELASGYGRTVLFTRTKHGAKKLAQQLDRGGIPTVELHGNLSQGARNRNLQAFSRGSARVLVATDIAARGIHVDDIALVVHVDLPADSKAYLHRSGRTARAGAAGTVVTLLTPEQRREVTSMTRKAGISVKPLDVRPGSSVVRDLAGPEAPKVAHRPRSSEDQDRPAHGRPQRPAGGRRHDRPKTGGRGNGSGRGNAGGRGKAGSQGNAGSQSNAGGRGNAGAGAGGSDRPSSPGGRPARGGGRPGGQPGGSGRRTGGGGRRTARPAGSKRSR